ncbi:MAG: hypothetical protein DRJ51_00645 [Thermoprotei archaeon]|nr:MAG: hypothetical protein DRJ51_00645 [Thermoprotei archaeon]RLF03563.1 MAG: hypothetical protein DRJ59_00010 [Thermoprotei archaeon]
MRLLRRAEALEITVLLIITVLILSYPDVHDPFILIVSFLSAFTGVFFHEIFHKYFALRRGRRGVRIMPSIPGILLGIITALRSEGTLVLMQPAYVMWEEEYPFKVVFSKAEEKEEEKQKKLTEYLKQDAEISLAGPAANGVVSVFLLASLLIIKLMYGSFYDFLVSALVNESDLQFLTPLVLYALLSFNSMLSFINLVPIPLPPIMVTDGAIFLVNAIELHKRGRLKDAPWTLFLLSLIGAILYILFLLGTFEEVLQAYDVLLEEA